MDLIEDALAIECPAIVHSVRIGDLALGTTPLRVNHIRALSDREWFEGLEVSTNEKGDREGKIRVSPSEGPGADGAAHKQPVEDVEGGDYVVRRFQSTSSTLNPDV